MTCSSIHQFRFGRWISVFLIWARDVAVTVFVTVDTKLICFVFLYIFIFQGVYFPYYFPQKLSYEKVVKLKDRFSRSYYFRLWFPKSFCNQHLEIGVLQFVDNCLDFDLIELPPNHEYRLILPLNPATKSCPHNSR